MLTLCLALAASGGSGGCADELRGKVDKNDAARIARPQLPPLSGQASTGAASGSAIDPGAFKVQAGERIDPHMDPSIWRPAVLSRRRLSGENNISRYMAAERNWRASQLTRDTGLSDIRVTVNIALCPPSNAPQRRAWETLMDELADPSMAPAWKQWQDTVTNAVLERRFFGSRINGNMSMHVRILRNGTVEVRAPHGQPFWDAVHGEMFVLEHDGKFGIPSSSQTTEVHAMVNVSEHTPFTKDPVWPH